MGAPSQLVIFDRIGEDNGGELKKHDNEHDLEGSGSDE
jgi:hypothetical protein